MDATNADAIFQTGHAHHVAGRLAEAEKAYRSLLANNPDHVDALHYLGVIALQCGQAPMAVQLIGQSVARSANFASLNNLGEALRVTGRLDEALACFNRSLQLQPNHADAMANIGIVLTQQKKREQAEQFLHRALTINPKHVGAAAALASLLDQSARAEEAIRAWNSVIQLAPRHANFHRAMGDALVRNDDTYRGIASYRRALELAPDDAQTHSKLGIALSMVHKLDEALVETARGIELSPDRPQAYFEQATVLERAGLVEEAIEFHQKAVELDPSSASLHGALGRALSATNRPAEAIDVFTRGQALDPSDFRFSTCLAKAHFETQQYHESLAAAREAVRIAPNDPECHASLAFSLLALGQFQEGFAEYEWRWRSTTFTTKPRNFDRPLWDGSDIAGRTLLVHSEQGFGDIFQFLRYVPLLIERKINVCIEVPYKIAGLVRRMSPALRVVIAGTILPAFEMHVPMLSLPAIFGTTLHNLPASVPYLRADPALAERWRIRLDELLNDPEWRLQPPLMSPAPTTPGHAARRKRVGLVWAGSPKPDPRRSATLNDFAALADLDDIALIALQPDKHAAEADDPPAGMRILNLGSELRDFSDTTASIFANLDLLITIDTSSAHLAGAMGIPTWILLPHAPDWRWLVEDRTSPWYSTVRLFKQRSLGDWREVIDRVAGEIRKSNEQQQNEQRATKHRGG